MSVALRALEIAATQVGVHEATGHNDGDLVEGYTFGQRVPWCAFFVAWCFRTAGFQLPGNRWLLGSCDYMREQLAQRGWLYDPSTRALPGDIVFFRTRMGSDPSKAGHHVGIVSSSSADEMFTIEGNTSNQVARRSYQLPLDSIVAIGRIP